jgi:hypothetical protein
MKGDAFEDKTTVEYVFVDGKEYRPAAPDAKKPGGRGGRRPNFADESAEEGGR